MCWHTSTRTLARNAGGTGSQLLNFLLIIGQNPCRNCFSCRSALEAETSFRFCKSGLTHLSAMVQASAGEKHCLPLPSGGRA